MGDGKKFLQFSNSSHFLPPFSKITPWLEKVPSPRSPNHSIKIFLGGGDGFQFQNFIF